MKNLITPIIMSATVLIGILLTSSFSPLPPQEEESIPRYHLYYQGFSTNTIAYDAVTGDYKSVDLKEFKNGYNIRVLLEN